jgi:hypothetical protein
MLMAQLAASLLMLAGLIVVSEFFTQLLEVLFVGASPPLLLTPRRPVLRMWRYASGFLTAGTLASLATGRPIPTGSIAVFVPCGWCCWPWSGSPWVLHGRLSRCG